MKGGCVNHEANGFWMFCIFSSDGNYISRDEIACFLSFNLQLARAFSIRLSFCSIEMGGFFFPVGNFCMFLFLQRISIIHWYRYKWAEIPKYCSPSYPISIEWTTSTTLGYSDLVLLRDFKWKNPLQCCTWIISCRSDTLQIHWNSVPYMCLVF